VLKHLMSAGKRALGASIVIGLVLVFAVGGPQSPDAAWAIRVAIAGFFIFWIVFAFIFALPSTKTDQETRDEG